MSPPLAALRTASDPASRRASTSHQPRLRAPSWGGNRGRRAAIARLAVPWRPVVAFSAGGLLLLAVTSVWVTSPIAGLTLPLSVPALAGAAAYLLDEPAAEVVAAAPIPMRAQSGSRLMVAEAILALGALGLGVVALRSGTSSRLGIIVQLAGCILVAVAASAVLRRRAPEPGDVVSSAVVASVLALMLARPFDRWLDLFPSEPGQRWAGSLTVWAVVATICVATAFHSTRDALD
jgi:hypothetical protein